MTMEFRMALLGLMILQTVVLSVLGAMIIKHDERMFQELQKLSACKLSTLVLSNPETRYQVGSYPNGSGK
jgi:hypothetical protein